MSSEQLPPLSNPSQTGSSATNPLYATAIAFIIIDTLIVALRFYSRFAIAKLPFGWDDFWVLPAYVLNIGGAVIGIVMHDTYTYHDPTIYNVPILDPTVLTPLLKSIYAIILLVMASYLTTRYSLLCLYLRAFSDRKTRIATWICFGLITAQWFAYTIAAIFACSPVDFYWNKFTIQGTCFNLEVFDQAITPPNLAFDIFMIAIPMPVVWKLHATKSRKIGLTLIFMIGLLALFASVVRFAFFLTYPVSPITPGITNILIEWIIIEPSIYLISVCLPASHHLFIAMTPSSVREAIDRGIAKQRAKQLGGSLFSQNSQVSASDRLRFSHRGGPNGEFSQLNDSDSNVGGRATAGRAIDGQTGHGSATIGDDKYPRGQPSEQMQIESGILVTTEITVTQEERIRYVIGV